MQNYAKAEVKYVRISPRKVKIVIDLIRNKPVGEALAILKHTPKAASEVVEKLLLSAMANAENNHGMDVEKLYVAEIYSNAGPMLKRIRARAQGRAFRILKRTSHTTIILKEIGAKDEVEVKKVEEKKPEVKEVKEVKKEAAPAEKKETAAKKPASTAKKATTAKKEAAPAEKKETTAKKTTSTAKKTTSTAAKKTTTKTTAKKADGEEAPKPSKPRAKKADTAKTEEA